MRKFYIILTSTLDYDKLDYDKEVSEVVAWTENPYIAISYFKEYREIDSDANMVIYGCNSHMELINLLKEIYNTEMEDILNSHLASTTSKNERCYVTYKEKYSELFTNKFIQKHKEFICDYICRIMLSATPLMKYVNPEYNEVISNLLFIIYTYTSIKKMIRHGLTVDLEKTIDLVYFWKFVMYSNPNQMITANSEMLNPTAVVFIDSGVYNRRY